LGIFSLRIYFERVYSILFIVLLLLLLLLPQALVGIIISSWVNYYQRNPPIPSQGGRNPL